MITAFQIGAFQFTGFQEGLAGGGGAYRPHLSGWGLRHVMELVAQRRRKALADAQAERERIEDEERKAKERGLDVVAEPVMRDVVQRAVLNLRGAPVIDVDAELEEFGALMKMIAEMDEVYQ